MKFNYPSILFFLFILSCSTLIDSCKHQPKTEQENKTTYTCLSHPEIITEKQGNCPICKQPLELNTVSTKQLNVTDILKPKDDEVLNATKLIKPENKVIDVVVNANGYLTYSTSQLQSITAKVSGKITRLYIKSLYQDIRIGDKLFEIDSPELVSAEKDLLIRLKNNKNTTAQVEAARRKLLSMGLRKEQLEMIEKTGRVMKTTTVFSPFAGYLIANDSKALEKSSNPTPKKKFIGLKIGDEIVKGQTLFKLANTYTIWGIARIYGSDINLVRINQPVELFNNAKPNPIYKGKIDVIEPITKEDKNGQTIRIGVNNTSKTFKIGQAIKATVFIRKEDGIWIPRSSMIDLGTKKVVFIEKENKFEAIEVIVSTITTKWVKIEKGIGLTDHIVEKGQLLLDTDNFTRVN